jgi:hypothetical protein
VLLSLAALKGASEDELIEHCTAVAKEMPLVGFYLQTAVGGIPLSRAFWGRFAAIDNVVAIKVAPFNRYRTLDVAFGIAQAHAEDRITLYTGNDDHIVADLVTPLVVRTGNREVTLRFQGGLLGHWSVWTRGAVKLLERLKLSVSAGAIPPEMLALDSFVTDCNSVVFDVDHDFRRLHPGLPRDPAAAGADDLDRMPRSARDAEPGQSAGIDRLYATYPELHDDAFVAPTSSAGGTSYHWPTERTARSPPATTAAAEPIRKLRRSSGSNSPGGADMRPFS